MRIFSWAVAAGFVFLTGTAFADADPVIGKVADQEIRLSQLQREVARMPENARKKFATDAEWRNEVVNKFIGTVALEKRAEHENLDQEPDITARLEESRRAILAQVMVQRKLAQLQPTEEDVKAYFEENRETFRIPAKVKLLYTHAATVQEAAAVVEKVNNGEIFERAADGKVVPVTGWVSEAEPFISSLKGNVSVEDIKLLFQLAKGDLSNVITGEDGRYYVFVIADKIEGGLQEYENVKSVVQEWYMKQAQKDVVDAYITETMEMEQGEVYTDVVAKVFEDSADGTEQ